MSRGFFCALLFAAACSVPASPVIVPGERVGEYKLGDRIEGEVDGLVFLRTDGKISGITVLSRTYRTKDGLGVGSLEGEVLAALGPPKSTSPRGALATRSLGYEGVFFLLDLDDKVESVHVVSK